MVGISQIFWRVTRVEKKFQLRDSRRGEQKIASPLFEKTLPKDFTGTMKIRVQIIRESGKPLRDGECTIALSQGSLAESSLHQSRYHREKFCILIVRKRRFSKKFKRTEKTKERKSIVQITNSPECPDYPGKSGNSEIRKSKFSKNRK